MVAYIVLVKGNLSPGPGGRDSHMNPALLPITQWRNPHHPPRSHLLAKTPWPARKILYRSGRARPPCPQGSWSGQRPILGGEFPHMNEPKRPCTRQKFYMSQQQGEIPPYFSLPFKEVQQRQQIQARVFYNPCRCANP